jgi:hypothetical protein
MTTPEQPVPVFPKSAAGTEDLRRRINVAMVSYAVLGLSATAFGATVAFSKGQEQAGGVFFLFANLSLPAIGSFVTSIIFTVKARRYRAVLAIGIVHILFLAAIVLVIWRQSGEGASETPVDIAIMSYGVFFTAVAIWWFSAGKRRMIKASVPSQ